MKKIIIVISMFLRCGCSLINDEYEKFEHYDLTSNKMRIHEYYNKEGKENYAIGVLEDNSEIDNLGLFYKIDYDDYILLDKFIGYSEDIDSQDYYYYFYENKLYICGNFKIGMYSLNKEKFDKKELTFDTKSILSNIKNLKENQIVIFEKIVKVDSEYIYFNSRINNLDNSDFVAKCALSDYKCEKISNSNYKKSFYSIICYR